MGTHSPGKRSPLPGRSVRMLAILVVASWVGTAGVVIGALSLQGSWSRANLLIGAGLVSYAVAGAAANLIPEKSIRGATRFGAPPRVWIMLGLGVLMGLTQVVVALLPIHTPAHL